MKKLALLGASGHGRVVADAALAGNWEMVEFFDDAWPRRRANGPWPVVGDSSALLARVDEYTGVLVSIGDATTRLAHHQALAAVGANLITVIHPAAVVSGFAQLGPGSVVMAGAVVQIGTVIGAAVIVNTGATVDHDCELADGVHVCPGAHLAGDVRVGVGSWIGIGAAVRQGVRIGVNVLVGAGAVIVGAVADGLTVVGNPARALATPSFS